MRISDWSSDVCSSDLLDQNVAREELALGGALDAFLDLDHFLGRHQDVAKLLLQSGAIDALLERLHHRILILRVSVHDIPAHRHIYAPRPVRNSTPLSSTASSPHNSRAMIRTTTATISVVWTLCWRVGQTTLRISVRAPLIYPHSSRPSVV